MKTPNEYSAALVYSSNSANYTMGSNHPLNPVRLKYMHELMGSIGLLDFDKLLQVNPNPALQHEIERYHDFDYVSAIKTISEGGIVPNIYEYGIGPGDNPPYLGMYDSSALSVGSTMEATNLVTTGKVKFAFAPAGGVHHHAMAKRASGFGIFNDAVIAIRQLLKKGLRVAYIDIDCHHGDGVQAGFYDSDQVLTISIHESGEWLFPGTGSISESGTGDGLGYSINIPLAPFTQTDVWLNAFNQTVPQLVRNFNPDILFTQLGIDTHFQDPLTHLQLSVQGFSEVLKTLKALGAGCEGWIAVGGGGYNYGAVARAWTIAMSHMADYKLPSQIPSTYTSINNLKGFADPVLPNPLSNDTAKEVASYAQKSIDQVRKQFSIA